jgi:ADP-ribose pyrophosphatase
MSSLFFYGTLRHAELLSIVLGRPIDMQKARLDKASVYSVERGRYPRLVLGTDGTACGVVVHNLTPEDLARLTFYEGGFDYYLHPVETSIGPAKVFLGPELAEENPQPWDLAEWEKSWAALTCEAAREAMRLYGQKTPQDLARMMPAILTRASARLRGKEHPTGRKAEVEIHARDLRYADFFALEEMTLQVENHAGGFGPKLKRAVFLGMDAAIVLPYDPVRDRVLLIEQMRMGPLGRNDAGCWQFEPIAGHVDPGETPRQAAMREAREEANLTLSHLESVAECYPSPGACSEFYYIYVGLADLPDGIEGISGLAGEGEDIRSCLLSFEELMERCDADALSVAPLYVAALWLARHRDRLRNMA